MAVARKPISQALAAVAVPGTSVAPSVPIPDNCIAITIQNPSAVTILFGVGVPGVALVAGVNGTPVAAGTSMVLPLGPVSNRGIMDETQLTGSGIVYDGAGAANVVITYQNIFGTGF